MFIGMTKWLTVMCGLVRLYGVVSLSISQLKSKGNSAVRNGIEKRTLSLIRKWCIKTCLI